MHFPITLPINGMKCFEVCTLTRFGMIVVKGTNEVSTILRFYLQGEMGGGQNKMISKSSKYQEAGKIVI